MGVCLTLSEEDLSGFSLTLCEEDLQLKQKLETNNITLLLLLLWLLWLYTHMCYKCLVLVLSSSAEDLLTWIIINNWKSFFRNIYLKVSD